jgi:transcriptional regulator with XRE-family HTH domain
MSQRVKEMVLRSDRLRQLRERAGLSQQELADAIKVSKRQIGRYEQGAGQPTADILARMAKILNCSVDYLLDLSDSPNERAAELSPELKRLVARFSALPQDIQDAIMRLVFRD